MAFSRRLRGEPTETEELERVLRESMLEGMLPVELTSIPADITGGGLSTRWGNGLLS